MLDDEDYDLKDLPTPIIELEHKSIDHELFMWSSKDLFSIVLWKRTAMGNKLLEARCANDREDALHVFANIMNEKEMYT